MSFWVSREEKRRLDQYSPIISTSPFGAALAGLLERIGFSVESAPAMLPRLYVESPANEVIDRWLVQGAWKLVSLRAYPVDGISASSAGIYTLTIRKEVNGVETNLQVRDINTGGNPFTNQTIEEVVVGAGYLFSDGEFLQVAIESDNADLTGGNGISLTPRFERY